MNLAHQPSGSPRRISSPQPGRLMLLPPTRILAEEALEGQFLTVSDLRQGAMHLAAELRHDPARAKWEPVGWYREAYDDPRFSTEQAMVLREMTIELCSDAHILLKYQKQAARAARRSRASEGLNAAAFAAVLIALLWLVPMMAQVWQSETATAAVSSR